MTTTGRFDLTSWDEEVYDDAEGARLVRVAGTKTFEGGVSGTSAMQLLQAIADPSAAYVGIERLAVSVDGRSGTFVLRHSAVGSASGGDMTVDVVPDSATGALRGLTGRLTIDRSPEGEHTYAFTYELG
ncbi:DUF3224 domain-containing protein [Pseudonocardia broussonetiae]|uniref:DUF3224 domain-containing protein n=1 Tax=Pseudonocardia broussonetiae TaxID=2736640 RepID=A0A6M6JDL2_9PSEU|nr:DUF3224 domain-containing protein [Pseudonocardia broussonetiae]QJY45203.1 DUF3224 domain-containing protein [Pseudonocardia broussonetiae]